MTEFVVWLDDVDSASPTAVAGGKMGRLSELAHVGLKVPRGFTVTAAAYVHQCAKSGLRAYVEEQLSTLTDHAECDHLAAVAKSIGDLFEQTPVEPKLATEIAAAYAELSSRCAEIDQPVAVRSSAVGEDSERASFSGIFDTYLGMSSEQRVLEALKRCWASLFSVRALSYRLKYRCSHHDMPMAVGVLEFVRARASGVAFSVHPVTGKRDRMVIEGNWGWGESVVRAAVTPDHIEVCKADRRVLSYQVADKQLVSTFDAAKAKVVETETPPLLRRKPILSGEEIGAVVEAVGLIEDHYGYPVDVEWVIENGRRPGEPVCIVQARPVTVEGDAAIAQGDTRWDPGAYALKYAFGKGP